MSKEKQDPPESKPLSELMREKSERLAFKEAMLGKQDAKQTSEPQSVPNLGSPEDPSNQDQVAFSQQMQMIKSLGGLMEG